jgi:diguanylate cyclase (GGDEF)-like protein
MTSEDLPEILQQGDLPTDAYIRRLQDLIVELMLSEARLHSLATTDSLTGVKNRRAFDERLEHEFRCALRYEQHFSVMLLDIDHFKLYNDAHGHPTGDRVLIALGQLLIKTARSTDFVARYGGEEFGVLLPMCNVESSIEAGNRVRAAVATWPWELGRLTVSIGLATGSATTQSAVELIEEADRALYASKRTGRNCVTHAEQLQTAGRSTRTTGSVNS